MAVSVPKLPEGFVAQMAAHRDIDNVCYEFSRVYDKHNKLVKDLSYWLITPIGDDHGVDSGTRPTKAISWHTYQEANGKLTYDAFSSPTVPVEELARWMSGNVAAAVH